MDFCLFRKPRMGLEDRLTHMIDPPAKSKRVAVIGGGVAGMEAALTAANRGHSVTLYEKTDHLGGQLLHADYPAFKWPLRNFKDYMIRQTRKADIAVKLNTEATPAAIKAEGFDAVILACGSVPQTLEIPVPKGNKIWLPLEVYGHESDLGSRVVVTGGGEIGAETALYLAECGHQVTLLTRKSRIAPDATCTHYREMFEERWSAQPNFQYILEVQVEKITKTGVVYRDAAGVSAEIPADSVVTSAGRKPLSEFAFRFFDCAEECYIVGDCKRPGNVQTCMRTSYAAASRI